MPLFISDEEFSRLSGDPAAVAVRADAYIRGVLHDLDTVRAKADPADINAEQNCSLIEQRYLSLTAEFSKLESNASNLQSSLDQCLRDLSGVQAQNHQIHLQSNELKAKWEEERSRLEKSKNESEKKYDEINEQNKILHSRLETLRIQWAEAERNVACFSPGRGGDIFGDAGLHNFINYLCRSEEIEETDVPLLKLEKLLLQSQNELKAKWEAEKSRLEKSKNDAEKKYDEIKEQLESAFKVAESTHASLEAEGAKARSFLFTEEEFKSLQLQVREMNLLRESNMQLREESKHNLEECQKLRELAQKARAETQNLGNLLREREVKLESKEIELLKTKKDHLNHMVSELLPSETLLETSKNVGAEDYDRVKKLVRGLQNKLRDRDAQIERSGRILSAKQDSISSLERDLSNCRLELKEREKRINDILHTEANLKLDVEKHRKLLAQFKKKMDVLSREKDDLGKENQQLSRQLGKRSTSDTTGDQAMKEEKDTRMQILEKTLEKVRAELNKEKEDKCMERSRRLKTEKAIKESYNDVEQGKNQFIDDLKKHREALKRLFDEVEKLNLHEGTNVAQILSGFNVDDFSAPYISAVENFAKEAHSVFGSCRDTSTITDSSATATGPLVHAQPTSSLLPKRLALTKSSVETCKAGRRLFRPLVKLDEPQGDSESTLTSSAAESSSSKLILPVPKQGTVSVTSETEEIKRASLISSMSTTINLTERARERAQLRHTGVIPTTARGHGRAPCGRVVRGRGRRPTSREA